MKLTNSMPSLVNVRTDATKETLQREVTCFQVLRRTNLRLSGMQSGVHWLISIQNSYHLIAFELQSVSWILAEFYFNRGLQRLYTGTCIILQKTVNEFLCLFIVFLKSKTYQLILKDVIKLNRNLL